jgi:hypothetical protein
VLFSVATADSSWVRLYDGPSANQLNRAADVCADEHGNVYVCGSGETGVWPWNTDMLVAKYSEAGSLMWVRSLGGTEGVADMAHAMAIDSTENVYYVGRTENTGPRHADISWLKYDSSGNVPDGWDVRKTLWVGDDAAYDMAIGRYGDVYACGAERQDTLGQSEFLVLKINASDGNTVWARHYALAEGAKRTGRRDFHPEFLSEWWRWENCATSLAVKPDGSIVAAGFGLDIAGGCEIWVMEFDTAGNRRWQRTYGASSGFYDDVALKVVAARTGDVYVTGFSDSDENYYDWTVLRINDTGCVTAVYSYRGMLYGDDFPVHMAIDSAAVPHVYVTGVVEHPVLAYQIMTQRLSSELRPEWGTNGALYGGGQDDIGYHVTYDDGRVYVAGVASDDIAAVCYPADSGVTTSDTLWTYRYDSPDSTADLAASICARGSDHVYLAGQCGRRGSWDWASLFLGRLPGAIGVEEDCLTGLQSCTLTPVPCSGTATLQFQLVIPGELSAKLYDAAGRLARAFPSSGHGRGSMRLDLSDLPAGVYLLQVEVAPGCRTRRMKVLVD